jgi:hypothetical protein
MQAAQTSKIVRPVRCNLNFNCVYLILLEVYSTRTDHLALEYRRNRPILETNTEDNIVVNPIVGSARALESLKLGIWVLLSQICADLAHSLGP